MAAPTPELRSCVTTSTRGSPAARAAAAVPSRDASSTTKIRSTKSGTPWMVVVEDVCEVDAEHRLRGRVTGAAGLPLDHGNLLLVRGDALLEDVDLLFRIRRKPLDYEPCECVRGNLRFPPGGSLHGDLNEGVRGAHGPRCGAR